MGFFSIGNNKKRTVIFDIGTSSVGGAYIAYKDSLPHILFHKRLEADIDDYENFERYFTQTLSGLNNISKLITTRKDYSPPQRIACFLPSVLYMSEIRTITYKEDKPVEITKAIVSKVIDEEISKSKKSIAFEREIPDGKPVILAQELINLKLNGYVINEPYGKKADELTLTLFISYTSDSVIKRIESEIHKIIQVEDIEFRGAAHSLYNIINNHLEDQNDYLLYNLNGEITELLVVRSGKLSQIVTYPFGRRTLVRKLRDRLNINYKEAETILKLYLNGGIDKEEREKVRTELEEIKKEWKVGLSLVFDRMSRGVHLPSRIFMSNAKEYSDLFKNWLIQERKELLLPEAALKVSLLKENFMVQNFYISNQDYTDDVPLVLESIFTNETNMK